MSGKPGPVGLGKRNSGNRGRPSPSGSATFGESRMQRSNSGSRFTDRSQQGSFPTTPMAADVRSTFSSREVIDALQGRVMAASERFKAWSELPEHEKKNRKRKSTSPCFFPFRIRLYLFWRSRMGGCFSSPIHFRKR